MSCGIVVPQSRPKSKRWPASRPLTSTWMRSASALRAISSTTTRPARRSKRLDTTSHSCGVQRLDQADDDEDHRGDARGRRRLSHEADKIRLLPAADDAVGQAHRRRALSVVRFGVRTSERAQDEAAKHLLDELNFDYRAERAETLSGGTRQKLNLALSLMDDPQLLLLDEPVPASTGRPTRSRC